MNERRKVDQEQLNDQATAVTLVDMMLEGQIVLEGEDGVSLTAKGLVRAKEIWRAHSIDKTEEE